MSRTDQAGEFSNAAKTKTTMSGRGSVLKSYQKLFASKKLSVYYFSDIYIYIYFSYIFQLRPIISSE